MLFIICQKWSKQIRYQTGFNFWTSFLQEYKVQTFSTRYETSSSRATTYDVRTTSTTHQGKNDSVFYENQSVGNERVLHVTGFPSSIQIQGVRWFSSYFPSRDTSLCRNRSFLQAVTWLSIGFVRVLFAELCPSNTALVFQIKAAKQSFMMITIILKIVQR